MKISIIGLGHVGTAMKALFPNASIYDSELGIGSIEDVKKCDAAFICVPTPCAPDGSCDTTIVEQVISSLEADVIIIRSTVSIGFTDFMMKKYKKEIVFQPEYYGETVAHPFADLTTRIWLSFGGTDKGTRLAVEVYQTVCNSNVEIHMADAKTVELAKYMENAFLATKVTFCNEMYDIAEAYGIDYHKAREVWLADPRIGRSHTFVYRENRGYGGKCLPKDISALAFSAKEKGINADLIKAVINKNKKYV